MNIQIGVVMGSSSDWDTMQHAVQILQQFGIAHEARVVSAHRMPDDMFAYAEAAGAGLQGHHCRAPAARPTCRACWRPKPRCRCWACRWPAHLSGVDSLHSIVQMPKGIPVATFAIGAAGAANAALFAVAMLANHDIELRAKLWKPSAPSRPRPHAPWWCRRMTLPPVL
jgi:5-(carboxyamino)imidazole ribonucleotide mutase